jgi:phosphoribosylglycinamide formyltransferase-1
MIKNSMVRLGIVGSSGGGALASAFECLKSAGKSIEWIVITDRDCGLEAWAKSKGQVVHRLDYRDADSFSSEACEIFRATGCQDVLLFYTRRIALPLFEHLRVWNIHPALLPSFGGLHGVRDAMAAGVRIFGATLHHVDAGLDTGKIIAQVSAPLLVNYSQFQADYLSYLQKVWLTLVWFEQTAGPQKVPDFDSCGPGVALASPGIADNRLRRCYEEWLMNNQNGIEEKLR